MVLFIKRFISFLASIAILSSQSAYSLGNTDISADCYALMHEGRLLYEKNADKRVPIASTTKLMTAIIVLENCESDEKVTVDADCCNIEGSSMYLKAGDMLTVEELLKGLLLVSGNDAALALAKHSSGSVEGFVRLMNEKAESLKLRNTHFTNPHGLNDAGHYSTARDMAYLMEYCMQNETFARINALRSCTVNGQTLINHNKLLDMCKGCKGGKTGYTKAAGRCLVSCCERNGFPLVCVTLSAGDDWNDHIKLYSRAFSEYELRNVTDGICFTIPLISREGGLVCLVPEGEYCVSVKRNEKVTLTARLPWFAFTPINAGERAGKAEISVDGETIGEYYLIYRDDIPAMKGNT